VRTKILSSIAAALVVASAVVHADVVIIGDVEYTCQSTCVVHIDSDGSYAVWDRDGGYVYWVIR
jgi:hypothetical protein